MCEFDPEEKVKKEEEGQKEKYSYPRDVKPGPTAQVPEKHTLHVGDRYQKDGEKVAPFWTD